MKRAANIGSMRQSVVIEAPTRARDGMNALVPTWAAVPSLGTVRAHVRPASTFERSAYAHDVGGVSHVVTIRHPGFEVTRKHRVNYGGRILEIRGVSNPDELDRFVVLKCDETVTGGGGTDGE